MLATGWEIGATLSSGGFLRASISLLLDLQHPQHVVGSRRCFPCFDGQGILFPLHPAFLFLIAKGLCSLYIRQAKMGI